jgi:hypothetical protein
MHMAELDVPAPLAVGAQKVDVLGIDFDDRFDAF